MKTQRKKRDTTPYPKVRPLTKREQADTLALMREIADYFWSAVAYEVFLDPSLKPDRERT